MFSEFSKKNWKDQWCGVLNNFQKSKEFSKFKRLGFLKNFAMANDMFFQNFSKANAVDFSRILQRQPI